jgi:hypothetical protein
LNDHPVDIQLATHDGWALSARSHHLKTGALPHPLLSNIARILARIAVPNKFTRLASLVAAFALQLSGHLPSLVEVAVGQWPESALRDTSIHKLMLFLFKLLSEFIGRAVRSWRHIPS